VSDGRRLSARAGSGLVQDIRFAVRSFRRTPGFTLLAIVTLALGIAGTTSIFSVADAVLLRPLNLHDSDRLVSLWVTEPAADEWRSVVSGATVLDWETQARSFESMAAFRGVDFNLTGGDLPERIRGASITPTFFSVLDVSPALGRLPGPDDDRAAASRTVVLADEFWRARYGADPRILDRDLILNGEPYRVVAVLPAGFAFPARTLLYVPSPHQVPLTPFDREDMSADRSAGYLSVVARLRPGVSIDQAQAEMNTIAARMAADYPETKKGEGAAVVSVKEDLVGDLRPTILLLLGAVGLVLLIACANVANLLTIRASRRQRELAIRVSIGAGLPRIRRQLLTESVVLAIAGGIPGFLLAIWGTRALVALAPEGIPRLGEVSVDQRVFVFCAVATLVSGLVFGLAPLLGLSDRNAALTLKGATDAKWRSPGRLRDVVVIAEVALTLLLVNTAVLMVRTFRTLNATDPGFDPSGVLVAHVSLPDSKYAEGEAQSAFYEGALEKIRALPGVESSGTILTLPMHWAIRGTLRFKVQGIPSDRQDDFVAGYQVASPDYFKTMRIPLRRGRVIEPTDREDTETIAVINEAMARRFWPNTDPLGRRITFWGDLDNPETEWATIVGVVGNTMIDGLDQPAEPRAYMPVSQVPMPRSTFVVRTKGDPRALAPSVRKAVEDVDPSDIVQAAGYDFRHPCHHN